MAIPVLRSSEIRPRGLGRRVLRSSLLEALAYPHGVDRYVELVRPLLLAIRGSPGDPRLETMHLRLFSYRVPPVMRHAVE